MRALLFLTVAAALGACGGAQSGAGGAGEYRPQPLEAHVFLREYGGKAREALFAEVRDPDTVEPLMREARGAERKALQRELALAHLWAAEAEEEGRPQRRAWRDAQEWAGEAAKRSRDDALLAEMDFVRLWALWRMGAPRAASVAERFTTRRLQSGELLLIAWAIRGEIALAKERWEEARESFRYLLGNIEHPLYAYALFREGEALRGLDRPGEAKEAFEQARDMGCEADAHHSILRIAALASRQAGTPVHLDAGGQPRPDSCAPPPPAEGEGSEEDEQWRPAE